MKDSRGRLPSGETPCPKISRKHAAGCKQQEVYWIRRYLGRQSLSEDLHAARLERGVLIGEQKARFTEARCGVVNS